MSVSEASLRTKAMLSIPTWQALQSMFTHDQGPGSRIELPDILIAATMTTPRWLYLAAYLLELMSYKRIDGSLYRSTKRWTSFITQASTWKPCGCHVTATCKGLGASGNDSRNQTRPDLVRSILHPSSIHLYDESTTSERCNCKSYLSRQSHQYSSIKFIAIQNADRGPNCQAIRGEVSSPQGKVPRASRLNPATTRGLTSRR